MILEAILIVAGMGELEAAPWSGTREKRSQEIRDLAEGRARPIGLGTKEDLKRHQETQSVVVLPDPKNDPPPSPDEFKSYSQYTSFDPPSPRRHSAVPSYHRTTRSQSGGGIFGGWFGGWTGGGSYRSRSYYEEKLSEPEVFASLKDQFMGAVILPKDTKVDDAPVGGISGISYDPVNKRIRGISDAHGNGVSKGRPPRTFGFKLAFGTLEGKPRLHKVRTDRVYSFSNPDGSEIQRYSGYNPPKEGWVYYQTMDSEDIAFLPDGSYWIVTENKMQGGWPRILHFDNNGRLLEEAPMPDQFKSHYTPPQLTSGGLPEDPGEKIRLMPRPRRPKGMGVKPKDPGKKPEWHGIGICEKTCATPIKVPAWLDGILSHFGKGVKAQADCEAQFPANRPDLLAAYKEARNEWREKKRKFRKAKRKYDRLNAPYQEELKEVNKHNAVARAHNSKVKAYESAVKRASEFEKKSQEELLTGRQAEVGSGGHVSGTYDVGWNITGMDRGEFDGKHGVSFNHGLEALAVSADYGYALAGVEGTLFQDESNHNRIIRYGMDPQGKNWKVAAQYAYQPAYDFHLRALHIVDKDRALALESRYSGGKNEVRVYEVNFADATDINEVEALDEDFDSKKGEGKAARKALLLKFDGSSSDPIIKQMHEMGTKKKYSSYTTTRSGYSRYIPQGPTFSSHSVGYSWAGGSPSGSSRSRGRTSGKKTTRSSSNQADNMEGMTVMQTKHGPVLLLASDNNHSGSQDTMFMAFSLKKLGEAQSAKDSE